MDFSVLDHVPAPMFFLDPKEEIVYFNRESERLQNVFNTTFTSGENFLDIIPKARRELVRLTINQVKATKKKSVLESEYSDNNGNKYFFETTYSPFAYDDKNGSLTCVVIREITSEKVFQKKATQLSSDYTNLIETANAVIFSIDSKEYITEWNAECVRITQFDKHEALARKIDSFIAENCREQFKMFLGAAFKGNAGNNFEFQFRTNVPTPVTVLTNATPRTNNEGKIISILFVGHDITELSEYRKSLETIVKDRTAKLKNALQKEKELVDIKNKFVSMASHELRIPLSMIASSSRYVRDQITEPELLDKINTIEKQIAHMRALIDDVLIMGKADVSKISSSHQRLDIVSFIRKLSEEVSVNAHHSHEIIFKLSSASIEIDSDEKLLRNVFLNLLSNAIKFSPGRNKINVEVVQCENIVEIAVIDEGIGIAGDETTKIFEPFNRASNASSIKGTGLGLSIVKRAVDVLGGTLNIRSELGKGTVVTIRFNLIL
jgi:PAS domain S-box-containing protein